MGLIQTYSSKEALPPKVYRIAFDESWYPLDLYDKKEYTSLFSKDILQSIASDQHFFVQLVRTDDVDLLIDLDSEEFDGVLASILLYGEYEGKYISSKPYYLLGPVLVVSTRSHINSVKDLNGKTIGVISGGRPVEKLYKHTSAAFIFYDYNDRGKLIEDVANDVINGMILDEMTAHEFTNSEMYRNQLKIASVPLNNDGLRLIMKNTPENEKIIIKFNKGLEEIEENGVYTQLLKKWGLFNPDSYGKSINSTKIRK